MLVGVRCEQCGRRFLRLLGEVKRNCTRGRLIFCSRSCHATHNVIHNGHRLGKWIGQLPSNLGKPVDAFSPFRHHLAHARQRTRKNGLEFDLDVVYLKEIWDNQSGICPYTGWSLVNPVNYTNKHKKGKTPNRASLDRIDNSKGYTRGNVEFISMMAQYAKHEWDKEALVKFCLSVAKNHGALV